MNVPKNYTLNVTNTATGETFSKVLPFTATSKDQISIEYGYQHRVNRGIGRKPIWSLAIDTEKPVLNIFKYEDAEHLRSSLKCTVVDSILPLTETDLKVELIEAPAK